MQNIFSERKFLILLLGGLCLLLSCDSGRSSELQGSPEGKAETNGKASTAQPSLPPLITAKSLAKLVDAKTEGLKILEPGVDQKLFSKGHLPQAQFLHWIDDMTDPAAVAKYNNPSAKQFSKIMSRLGIESTDRIVIYDRFSSRLSTRLFWTFKTLGHEQVQVLDGGFAVWEAKFDLTRKTPVPTTSQYKATAPKKNMVADMEMVKANLKDLNCRLIDGRPEEQFSGKEVGKVYHTGKAHSRKGHIPGAKNVFWKDNFNSDGTFKSVVELRALYQSAGILPTNDVITYCNEGLHAAPPWFVLTQMLNYKNVRLYDSSMAEWAESKEPMTTLPASE